MTLTARPSTFRRLLCSPALQATPVSTRRASALATFYPCEFRYAAGLKAHALVRNQAVPTRPCTPSHALSSPARAVSFVQLTDPLGSYLPARREVNLQVLLRFGCAARRRWWSMRRYAQLPYQQALARSRTRSSRPPLPLRLCRHLTHRPVPNSPQGRPFPLPSSSR